MNNFIKVRGRCAPSSFCVYKIVFDFFAEIQYYVSRIVCLEWEDIFGFSQEEIDEQDDNILQGMRFLCAEDNELNAEILIELLCS